MLLIIGKKTITIKKDIFDKKLIDKETFLFDNQAKGNYLHY